LTTNLNKRKKSTDAEMVDAPGNSIFMKSFQCLCFMVFYCLLL
jgi:hypothetical protein